jgi:hypothetical protein
LVDSAVVLTLSPKPQTLNPGQECELVDSAVVLTLQGEIEEDEGEEEEMLSQVGSRV